MEISKFLRKVPFIYNIIRKIANEKIDLRLKNKKLKNEKINVVFVCHRPAVWESLHSVYDAMKQDEAFNVTIVAIPNKKELPVKWLNHEEYESEGAEEFWEKYGCINGFNYETKEWFDLKKLNPDYVFFQQPYNITRCPQYKSWVVAGYAKICYVAYASNFIGSGIFEETTPVDFVRDVSVFFTQNKMDDELVRNYLKQIKNNFTKAVITGFPRNDSIIFHQPQEVDIWKHTKEAGRFRVLWTPRWCTNEGNCNFFRYKDLLSTYMLNNDTYDFVFRPHPQAFANWISSGEISTEDLEAYKNKFMSSRNMNIDNNYDYLNTIYMSDCLITDVSSFIQDYFFTGKPVIYCHNKDCFNEFSREMAQGFYWVENFEQLVKTLEMLSSGVDPLKGRRQEILKSLFSFGELASEKVKKYILEM